MFFVRCIVVVVVVVAVVALFVFVVVALFRHYMCGRCDL